MARKSPRGKNRFKLKQWGGVQKTKSGKEKSYRGKILGTGLEKRKLVGKEKSDGQRSPTSIGFLV